MDTTRQPPVNGTPPRLAYSVQETARMLGVCDKSIRRLILRGLLRPSRALRHIRVPEDEVECFLRDTRGGLAAAAGHALGNAGAVNTQAFAAL